MIILHFIKICFTSSTNLDHIFKHATLFNDPMLSIMTLLPEFNEKFIVLNGFKFLIILFDTPRLIPPAPDLVNISVVIKLQSQGGWLQVSCFE